MPIRGVVVGDGRAIMVVDIDNGAVSHVPIRHGEILRRVNVLGFEHPGMLRRRRRRREHLSGPLRDGERALGVKWVRWGNLGIGWRRGIWLGVDLHVLRALVLGDVGDVLARGVDGGVQTRASMMKSNSERSLLDGGGIFVGLHRTVGSVAAAVLHGMLLDARCEGLGDHPGADGVVDEGLSVGQSRFSADGAKEVLGVKNLDRGVVEKVAIVLGVKGQVQEEGVGSDIQLLAESLIMFKLADEAEELMNVVGVNGDKFKVFFEVG